MSGDKPWIAGNLRIPAAVMAEIEAHALECYPSEACGFVMGPAGEPDLLDEARREENEADKYHRLDPETFPRTSAMYFKINELRAQRAFTAGEESGRPLKVIYHSHCDAGAYFSAEDAATFAQSGQLMWPCAYIVVSIQQGQVAEHRLHVHVPGTNDFVESPLAVF
jgi:proteasome lid subunit RPN8/RPN11